MSERSQRLGQLLLSRAFARSLGTNVPPDLVIVEGAGPFPSLIFDERLYPKNKPAMMLYLPGKQRQNYN